MVTSPEMSRKIAVPDPGIDDYRNELLWTPDSPTLIDAEITLVDGKGRALDEIKSYTAMRQVALQPMSALGQRLILRIDPLDVFERRVRN